MNKKKAGKKTVRGGKKGKAKAQKSGGKKTIRVKQMDMAKVRNDVANIVGSGAKKIAAAVVEEAKKGQLAPAKFLFEMAGVFPVPTESEPATGDDEESLAKVLMEKLKTAEDPKAADEEPDSAEEPVEPGLEKKDSGLLVV